MRRRKQTKAQKEYQRVRKNINQYQRRHGTGYELPETPTQILGKGKVKASDYRQYTSELKRFYKTLKETEKTRKKDRTEETYISFAEIVIQNFRSMIHVTDNPDAKGIPIIDNWLNRLISSNGSVDVALMILESQDKGLQLTVSILYNEDQATRFTEDLYKFFKATGMNKNDLSRLQDEAEMIEKFYNF